MISRNSVSLTLSLIFSAVIATPAHSSPCNDITIPANPHFDLKKGIEFSDTDAFRVRMNKAVHAATEFCQKHMDVPKPAVVLDIDETILDNRELIRKLMAKQSELKEWDAAAWDKWVSEAKIPEIKPTAGFVRWAHSKGIHVFLITARETDERAGTEANLKNDNIPYDELFLKDPALGETNEDFKSHTRAMLEKKGYTILCNIGDQFSDLYGLHAMDCEKIPNEMYFTK